VRFFPCFKIASAWVGIVTHDLNLGNNYQIQKAVSREKRMRQKKPGEKAAPDRSAEPALAGDFITENT
jgi:hypothetical protein